MLKEAKVALRVVDSAYDARIASVLMAGANDLKIAGVNLGGEVTFTVTNDQVVDNSTVTDPLVIEALLTYAMIHFFTAPKEYQQYKDSYDEQKTQLMHSTGYTTWGDESEQV